MDGGIRARFEDVDRHRAVGVLTVAGLVAGAAIAVFGLPPIEVHSPLRLLGMVCPFCGATRAVQALFQADLHTAWMYNPIAFLVIAAGAVMVVRGVAGLAAGRWLNVTVTRPRLVYLTGGLAIGILWVNQARHAAMLRAEDGSLLSELFGVSVMLMLGGLVTFGYLTYATRRMRAEQAKAAGPAPGEHSPRSP